MSADMACVIHIAFQPQVAMNPAAVYICLVLVKLLYSQTSHHPLPFAALFLPPPFFPTPTLLFYLLLAAATAPGCRCR